LVSTETFEIVQDILIGRKKKLSINAARTENLPLRGYLYCKQCGGKLTGSNSKSRNGSLHSYYHCQKACKERFREDTANTIFIDFLRDFEISDAVQAIYLEVLSDVFKANDADRNRERLTIEEQIKKLENRLDALNDRFIDGDFDAATYKQTKDRYENARNELLGKLNNIQPEGAVFRKYLAGTLTISKNLSRYYSGADLAGKQQLVGSIFPDKIIFDQNKYRTTQLNDGMQLICRLRADFEGQEIKKPGKISGLSTFAPPAGLEPATL
jgi:site-specific DNA recombinase